MKLNVNVLKRDTTSRLVSLDYSSVVTLPKGHKLNGVLIKHQTVVGVTNPAHKSQGLRDVVRKGALRITDDGELLVLRVRGTKTSYRVGGTVYESVSELVRGQGLNKDEADQVVFVDVTPPRSYRSYRISGISRLKYRGVQYSGFSGRRPSFKKKG